MAAPAAAEPCTTEHPDFSPRGCALRLVDRDARAASAVVVDEARAGWAVADQRAAQATQQHAGAWPGSWIDEDADALRQSAGPIVARATDEAAQDADAGIDLALLGAAGGEAVAASGRDRAGAVLAFACSQVGCGGMPPLP